MLKRNTAMKDKQGRKCDQHISNVRKLILFHTSDSGFFERNNSLV